MRNPVAHRVQFGPFVVDLHTHEVRKDGTRIRLIGQPFDILSVLIGKPGELVTREELRMRLWPGDTFVDFDHGLNAAVNKLRETLCDSADHPRFVETLPRRGYRFIAPVERLDALEGQTNAGLPPIADTNFSASSASPRTHSCTTSASVADSLGRREIWWIPRRLNPWLSSLAVSAALLLIFFLSTRGKGPREALANSSSSPWRMLAFTGTDEDARQPSFSPDGKRIAFTRSSVRAEDSGIFVKQLGDQNQTQLTKNRHDRNPVWAPDGKTIALSRWEDPNFILLTVPAAGGAEQKLDTRGIRPKRHELDWSADRRWIAFNGGNALYLLSLGDGAVRPLTNPPPAAEDRAPGFSTDSKQVLFVRNRGGGIPEEIRVVNVDGGEEALVTAVTAEIVGTPRWSVDGYWVLFSSNFGGRPGLWRVSTDKRDSPIQISDSAAEPALARQGRRLAYERGSRGLNIWQLTLTPAGGGEQTILVPLTGQTDQGPAPQVSSDGRKLAFMSDRSGTMEIWVADADGRNARQLTAIGNAGTPRWSPDSKAIVFDAKRKNGSSIYTVALEDGETRLVTPDDFENRCPSWSRNGEWIYFTSHRTGRFEVWKTRATGGTPLQLTRNGGHAALEAPDGKHIFYAKTPLAYPEIWQADVQGGREKLLSRNVRPAMWATWAVVDKGNGGILFAQPSGTGAPVVSLFDLATHRVKTVGQASILPFWLGATLDGKKVVFDQPGWQQSQIMLVENFR